MKGRIRCPNCSTQFNSDLVSSTDDTLVTCPSCNHTFNIHSSNAIEDICTENDRDECSWEEHGGSRKTILSSIKPRTDKPMIASILLIVVVSIGIISSITPGLLLQTPTMILSSTGMQGSITVMIEDNMTGSFHQISLHIPQEEQVYTGIWDNDSIQFHRLPVGKTNGQLIIHEENKNQTLPFELFVIPFVTNSYTLTEQSNQQISPYSLSHDGFGWCSSIVLILSVICLIGLLSSWKRYYSDVALIGCLIGAFTIGYFFINTILCVIAFFLIYHSRDEFDDGKKGKSF